MERGAVGLLGHVAIPEDFLPISASAKRDAFVLNRPGPLDLPAFRTVLSRGESLLLPRSSRLGGLFAFRAGIEMPGAPSAYTTAFDGFSPC